MVNGGSALKDQLGVVEVRLIRDCMRWVLPKLDADQFYTQAVLGLDALALKARVTHIIACLHQVLPPTKQALKILLAMGQHWRTVRDQNPDTVHVFGVWPLIDYVGVYGLGTPESSLEALKALTDLHTSEFAIRPFVKAHPALAFRKIHAWIDDENEHVRRLCSEGVRPRLPWGAHLASLKSDPEPIFGVLKKLMTDPSRYVQKSVANNLNDIAKDHPDPVVAFCKPYFKGDKTHPVTRWIITHGLRTLVKQGDSAALGLLGFDLNPNVQVTGSLTRKRIQVGQAVEFQIQLENQRNKPQRWVVDYQIGFVMANGERSYKTYKLKNMSLEASGGCDLVKSHHFKPLSTRRYYPGDHEVVILVNGAAVLRLKFKLRV